MNSKQILADSLEKLLMKKNLDNIQVSEIVAGTSLSRKTFYRHFKENMTLPTGTLLNFMKSLLVVSQRGSPGRTHCCAILTFVKKNIVC